MGKMPQAEFWIAGWHFNSAIVRIAASYDRALGVLKRRQRRQRIPSPPAIQHKHVKIDKIRKEANSSEKHKPDANEPGRDVQFQEALEGFEELLDLIAQCCVDDSTRAAEPFSAENGLEYDNGLVRYSRYVPIATQCPKPS